MSKLHLTSAAWRLRKQTQNVFLYVLRFLVKHAPLARFQPPRAAAVLGNCLMVARLTVFNDRQMVRDLYERLIIGNAACRK